MTLTPNNPYTKMQESFYDTTAGNMAKQNHRHHDKNFDYWEVLLRGVREGNSYLNEKKALDLGCGTGRNICNLLRMANWKRVDGVDISKNNLIEAEKLLKEDGIPDGRYKLFKNNGVDLKVLENNFYEFVMSTIVLQHIPVYTIRYSLMSEVYRVLQDEGVFSFQMGFGVGYGKSKYYDNTYTATGTNSEHDVEVSDPEQLLGDLKKIGFKYSNYVIKKAFDDGHPFWIYALAIK